MEEGPTSYTEASRLFQMTQSWRRSPPRTPWNTKHHEEEVGTTAWGRQEYLMTNQKIEEVSCDTDGDQVPLMGTEVIWNDKN